MSLFDDVKNNPKYTPANSIQWFQHYVTNAFRNMGTQKFLGLNQPQQTSLVVPGKMIFFGYDPKGKDELPFYDKFPLLLPFNADSTHFIGLNLHYLPPLKRILILDNLLNFSINKTINPKKKIQLSWELLKTVSNNKAISFCVKKYLFGHVKTRFVTVKTDDWVIASMLPLARFSKATEQQVWRKISR